VLLKVSPYILSTIKLPISIKPLAPKSHRNLFPTVLSPRDSFYSSRLTNTITMERGMTISCTNGINGGIVLLYILAAELASAGVAGGLVVS
jgi:hypothetical protein